jgi:hypothetical protein
MKGIEGKEAELGLADQNQSLPRARQTSEFGSMVVRWCCCGARARRPPNQRMHRNGTGLDWVLFLGLALVWALGILFCCC